MPEPITNPNITMRRTDWKTDENGKNLANTSTSTQTKQELNQKLKKMADVITNLVLDV